jgi:LytS/YehU family sensor histidine kinase
MHPVFSNPRRLGAYLAAWFPISVLVTALVAMATGGRLGLVAALVMPLMLFFASPSLAAWYICRAFPVSRGVPRIAVVQLISAIVSAAVWLVFGQGLASLLSGVAGMGEAESVFRAAMPILFVAALLLFWLSASVSYLLIAIEESQARERAAIALQVLARESELKALTAQVHPHFLFNSLNSISALAATDGLAARTMAVQLADFFRKSLSIRNQEMITLAEELSLIDSFLAIEQVRFGDRLRIERSIEPEALACLIPPLLLQPLAENAVTHGIATLLDGGAIRVAASKLGERLIMQIENGYDPEARSKGSGGVGVANVRDRIALIWGDSARMDVTRDAGVHRVAIEVPVVR